MKELIEIQSRLKAPKNQFNNFGKYNYRNCEDILEALKPLLKETKTSLTLSDEIVQIGDRYYVKATAVLSNGQENDKSSAFAREAETKKGMDDAQITGSARCRLLEPRSREQLAEGPAPGARVGGKRVCGRHRRSQSHPPRSGHQPTRARRPSRCLFH